MIRFILHTRIKDRYNGLEQDFLRTLDADVPDLEALLLSGGLAPDGYEVTDLAGVEVFPPRATGQTGDTDAGT